MKVSDLLKYLLFVLALAGVWVSIAAWRVHNSDPGTADVCSINEHWDCGTVQHSRYAEIKGVPVAAMGVAGYAAFLFLLIFDSAPVRKVFFAMAVVAMGFALYLTYIEQHILQTWCLYCVISQGVITLVLLASGARLFFDRKKA